MLIKMERQLSVEKNRPVNSLKRIIIPILRITLAVLALFCCYRLSVSSANSGYSRLLSMFSIISTQVEPSDIAVKVAPNDPEAHYTRALELVNFDRLEEA